SARLQVSARNQVIRLLPSCQWRGGTIVEFVAIAGDDQRPPGMALPRKCQHTHRRIIAARAASWQQYDRSQAQPPLDWTGPRRFPRSSERGVETLSRW